MCIYVCDVTCKVIVFTMRLCCCIVVGKCPPRMEMQFLTVVKVDHVVPVYMCTSFIINVLHSNEQASGCTL